MAAHQAPLSWDSPGKNTGVGCHFLLHCMKVKVKLLSHVQLLATPWTAAYQAPPPIFQARVPEWVAIASSEKAPKNLLKNEHKDFHP